MQLRVVPKRHVSHDEWHSCQSKLLYMTRRSAEVAIDEYMKQFGEVLKAYACVYCGWWHVWHDRAAPYMLGGTA